VLLGSAIGVLSKAGVDVPTWTVVGVPAIAGAGMYVLHRLRVRQRTTPEAAAA
jgi:hypothetical protein